MILAAALYWVTALAFASACIASALSLSWEHLAWGVGKAAGVLLIAVLLGARRGIAKRSAAQ